MNRALTTLALIFAFASLNAQEGVLRTRNQNTIVPQYITLSMKGLDRPTPTSPGRKQYVYVIFPGPEGFGDHGTVPIDTTLPNRYMVQARDNRTYCSTGDVGLSLVTDLTGTDESDSLASWIKPLFYDDTKHVWYASDNDSTFLVWGTPGVYTATSKSYFNWADGGSYTLSLSGELWPFAGFVLVFESCMDAQVASILSAKLGVWILE